MNRACRTAAAVLALALILPLPLTGCVKSTTFNPYAPPDTKELDRLQQQVNDRADLEPTRAELNQLEAQIRSAIAKHSPQTRLSEYGNKESLQACQEPYIWTIGQQYTAAPLSGRPAPNPAQWQQILDEVKPALEKAGFEPGKEPVVDGVSYGDDGGAFIRLTNGSDGSPLMYESSTGCRMPTAWRTSSPPPYTATGEATVHYPYLFGGEGGRTVKPG